MSNAPKAKMISYEEYKTCTEIYTSWLMVTAEDHGSTIQSSRPIEPVEARSGRPRKSAARKKWAKDRDAAAAANSTPDGRPIHLMSSREILKQGEFLSRLLETITMPRAVWQGYMWALAGRQQYAAKYARIELREDMEIDGHVDFIGVL